MAKKKIHIYCLKVDDGGGDGPLLFPVRQGRMMKSDQEHIDANFSQFIFDAPQDVKLEIVGLTKKEWTRAVKIGKEFA